MSDNEEMNKLIEEMNELTDAGKDGLLLICVFVLFFLVIIFEVI